MREQLLLFCNWSTLGVCAALKLPQIFAVLAARSARGISLPSLLLELAGFLVFLQYQCYYEYPLLTYLEYPILIAQDALLLLCVFHFNGNVKGAAPYLAVYPSVCIQESMGRGVTCSQCVLTLGRFVASWFVLPLQKWIIDLAMNLSTFISTASKFAQLQYLWKTRDSGAVSALSWSLASYTCATRIITTLMTTSDFTILVRFVIMLALNLWVTATVCHYRTTVVKAE
ncbi:solute carrier family 66 member 3 isoform X3 [Mirounga angustirostris]|uniref:solute carrier family 66 member 3 isoform X3 n=1 Tax=Mirounga angustirostris TaxID=9716 RepID=UPI00313E004E